MGGKGSLVCSLIITVPSSAVEMLQNASPEAKTWHPHYWTTKR